MKDEGRGAMSDEGRIEEALRAVAHAEASRDFSAGVRARIETPVGVGAARWPRVAVACAMVLLVAAVAWWPRPTPQTTVSRIAPAVDGVAARAVPPVPRVVPPGASTDLAVRTEGRASAAPPRHMPRAMASDHERALEPLPPVGALLLPSLEPDALVVDGHALAPLSPIAPLDHGAGDAERGEL